MTRYTVLQFLATLSYLTISTGLIVSITSKDHVSRNTCTCTVRTMSTKYNLSECISSVYAKGVYIYEYRETLSKCLRGSVKEFSPSGLLVETGMRTRPLTALCSGSTCETLCSNSIYNGTHLQCSAPKGIIKTEASVKCVKHGRYLILNTTVLVAQDASYRSSYMTAYPQNCTPDTLEPAVPGLLEDLSYTYRLLPIKAPNHSLNVQELVISSSAPRHPPSLSLNTIKRSVDSTTLSLERNATLPQSTIKRAGAFPEWASALLTAIGVGSIGIIVREALSRCETAAKSITTSSGP